MLLLFAYLSVLLQISSFTLRNAILKNKNYFELHSDNNHDSHDNKIEKKSQSSPIRIRSEEWARIRGMEPGYGGIWPGDPNAEKYKVTVRSKLSNEEYVTYVPKDRYIYFVYEENGIDLPIINQPRMCRQGCCTICTAKIIEGSVEMDNPLGLLKQMRKEGYFLTCCAYPKSDIICELQNEDEMFIKQWSEGFEGGGVEWGGFLPEDD